jgi:hypothetical protein
MAWKKYQPERTDFLINTDKTKHNSSVIRNFVYAVLLLLAFLAIYTIYDMRQAKNLAADVCNSAVKGIPLEDLLSKLPKNDYKIIKGTEYIMIVPKRGMGRNFCTVSRDGQKITGSKTRFND